MAVKKKVPVKKAQVKKKVKPKVTTPKFKKASEVCAWIAEKLSKDNWHQGSLAGYYIPSKEPGFEPDFKPTAVKNLKAETFCSIGWIDKCNQGLENEAMAGLISAINPDMDIDPDTATDDSGVIVDFNDDDRTRIHTVKAIFKKASKLLAKWEAKGKPLPEELDAD